MPKNKFTLSLRTNISNPQKEGREFGLNKYFRRITVANATPIPNTPLPSLSWGFPSWNTKINKAIKVEIQGIY